MAEDWRGGGFSGQMPKWGGDDTPPGIECLAMTPKDIENGNMEVFILGLELMASKARCVCVDRLLVEEGEVAGDCMPCKTREIATRAKELVTHYRKWHGGQQP